jgi:hypothetical protein
MKTKQIGVEIISISQQTGNNPAGEMAQDFSCLMNIRAKRIKTYLRAMMEKCAKGSLTGLLLVLDSRRKRFQFPETVG